MSEDTTQAVQVQITGSVTGLVAAMEEGAAVVKESTGEMTRAMGLLEIEAHKMNVAMEEAAAEAQTFGATVERVGGMMEAALAPMIAFLALFEGVEIISEAINKTAELAVQLEVLSQKTGLTVEEISRLKYAAEIAHVSVEEFSVGMQRLARGMEESAKQTGPAYEALKALGIAAIDATGHLRPMDTILLQLADKFSRMQDGAGKTALAMDLFGRSGANLIPFLNQGAEGIAELEKEADRLGITMNKESVAAAVAYEEAMKNLHGELAGVERQLVLGLIPALSSIATAFTEGETRGNAFRVMGEGLGVVLRGIATAAVISAQYAHEWALAMTAGFYAAQGQITLAYGELLRMKDVAKDVAKEIGMIWTAVGEKPAPPDKNTTPAPVMSPKDKVSDLDRLKEEWNKIKEAQLGGENDLLVMEIFFWKKKLSAAAAGSKEYLEIHAHLVQLESELAKKTEEREQKAAKAVQDEWLSTFKSIEHGWSSAVQSLKNTTASWGDFMRELFAGLLTEYAAFEAKSIIIHNAAWLEKRKVTAAGWALEVFEATAATIKIIAQYAYQAAAAAWASVSAIPIVGPFLAPAVALGTLAAVMSLAHGGGGGSPSAPSQSASASAPAKSASTVNNYYVNAIDSKSFHQTMMDNSASVAKAAAAGASNGVRLPSSAGRGSA